MSPSVTPEGFPILEDPNEVLRRRVHGSQLDKSGRPLPVNFHPAARDKGLLSTRRDSMTPQAVFDDWVPKNPHALNSIWSLQVGDANAEDLQCFDDSTHPDNPPAHASVDFRPKDDPDLWRQIGRKLADKAKQLHP